ncbi:hypothetical protein BPORC_1799 [Bifidobacterium porcinum]|nr:hypothetical protein BPORC_1799 [Bifidobacterium porcinum]
MRGVFCFSLSVSPPRPGYRPTCVSSGAPMHGTRSSPIQLVAPGLSSAPSVCEVIAQDACPVVERTTVGIIVPVVVRVLYTVACATEQI